MCGNFQSMQNNNSTSAMSAEAAAFVCAFLLVDLAVLAESIFVALFPIICVLILVLKLNESA